MSVKKCKRGWGEWPVLKVIMGIGMDRNVSFSSKEDVAIESKQVGL